MRVVEIGMQHMKARLLLARNIHAVLTARGEDQSGIARWCRRKPSWMNKILAGKRPMHIDDFDRVADYLGLSVYQLFQPGISALTERRKRPERRTGRDRRVGHAQRIVALQAPRPQVIPDEAATVPTAANELHALVSEFSDRLNRLLEAEDARGQAPRTRKTLSPSRSRRRAVGGSDAPSD